MTLAVQGAGPLVVVAVAVVGVVCGVQGALRWPLQWPLCLMRRQRQQPSSRAPRHQMPVARAHPLLPPPRHCQRVNQLLLLVAALGAPVLPLAVRRALAVGVGSPLMMIFGSHATLARPQAARTPASRGCTTRPSPLLSPLVLAQQVQVRVLLVQRRPAVRYLLQALTLAQAVRGDVRPRLQERHPLLPLPQAPYRVSLP